MERVQLKDSRGDANLSIRCHLCKRTGHIDLLPDSSHPYDAESSGQFKSIAGFDCRGVELIEFSPRVGWIAQGVDSPTKFDDISLNDGNWCDYDDEAKCEVSIFNVESRFVKVKR